jgi:hypothetical protein
MSAMHFLRLLAIVALIMTPLRAMAHNKAATSVHDVQVMVDLGHCDTPNKSQKGQSRPHNHCTVAAPGLPASGGEVAARPPLQDLPHERPSQTALRRLGPEAATPPPRIS